MRVFSPHLLVPMLLTFLLNSVLIDILNKHKFSSFIFWTCSLKLKVPGTHVLGPLYFIWWIEAKYKPSTQQTSRSCGTAGPAVIDSGGPSSIVKSPNIRCFVAKSGLSRFTRFLGVRFSAFDSNRYCQIGQWCYYYWFDIDSQSVLSIENLFYR